MGLTATLGGKYFYYFHHHRLMMLLPFLFSHSVVSDSLWPHGLHGAHQALLHTGFPRQEYRSGLQFPSPGDLLNPGIEPAAPALAGRCFTTEPSGKPNPMLAMKKLRLKESLTCPQNCLLNQVPWPQRCSVPRILCLVPIGPKVKGWFSKCSPQNLGRLPSTLSWGPQGPQGWNDYHSADT